MFFIIGLAHREQCSGDGNPHTPAQMKYVAALETLIRRVRTSCIAEEDSEEALASRKCASLAKPVAKAFGIEHRLRDPTMEERREIGYRDSSYLQANLFMHDDRNMTQQEIRAKARALEIAKYWRVREDFWLRKLNDLNSDDVIFVCGDGHVETFTALLGEKGIPFEIVEMGIGVNEDDDAEMAAGRQYLREHPEIVNEEV
jgi:hypothetical protein